MAQPRVADVERARSLILKAFDVTSAHWDKRRQEASRAGLHGLEESWLAVIRRKAVIAGEVYDALSDHKPFWDLVKKFPKAIAEDSAISQLLEIVRERIPAITALL